MYSHVPILPTVVDDDDDDDDDVDDAQLFVLSYCSVHPLFAQCIMHAPTN